MARRKARRPHITPGEPWADQARRDLGDALAPEWQALLEHALATAGRSKPTKKWLSRGEELIDAVGRDRVQETLVRWLARAAELPPGESGPRRSYKLLEGGNGDILRGLIWAAGASGGSALIEALGQAARTFAVKVRGLGQRSTRVTNACVTALALAAVRSDEAVAELLALKWAIDYPSTRAFIDRTIEDLCRARSATLEQLHALGFRQPDAAPSGVLSGLTRAEQALAAGDPGAALGDLLEIWRSLRAPPLAELVERVSARLAGTGAAALSRRTQKATLEAWVERARQRDPADVGILVDPALFPLGRDWAKAGAQLTELASFEPDPRIAAALAGWLLRPPFDSAASRDTWRLVLEELVRHDDPRTVERLGACDDVARLFAGSYRLRDWIVPAVRDVLAQLSARRAVAPAVPAECEAVIQRLEQILASSRAADPDALLAAILADPDDDQLRLVYADLLQQLGDPRGELITLQLLDRPTRTQRSRANEILARHARGWLGDLEPVLQRTGLVFRRGFLAAARLAQTGAALEAVIESPAWSTLEALDVRGGAGATVDALLRTPALRRLRELRGVTIDTARRLCSDTHDPLQRLALLGCADFQWSTGWLYAGWDELDDFLALLARHPGLPCLAQVALSCSYGFSPGQLGPLLSSSLETLKITTPELETWQAGLPLIDRVGASEVVLREHRGSRALRFTLDPKTQRLRPA
jgi:uncharacterized protein (TIGR02996 family)